MPSARISPQRSEQPIGLSVDRKGAAAQLGVPRTTLLARMQRLGILSEIIPKPSWAGQRDDSVQVMGELSSRLKDESSAACEVMEAVAG